MLIRFLFLYLVALANLALGFSAATHWRRSRKRS